VSRSARNASRQYINSKIGNISSVTKGWPLQQKAEHDEPKADVQGCRIRTLMEATLLGRAQAAGIPEAQRQSGGRNKPMER
jgi:hypothetical protein